MPSKCKDEFLLSHWGVDISMIDSLLIKLDAQFSKSPTNWRYLKITWWNLMNFEFWCVERMGNKFLLSLWLKRLPGCERLHSGSCTCSHSSVVLCSSTRGGWIVGSWVWKGWNIQGKYYELIWNQLFWTLVSSICGMCDLEEICDSSSKLKLWRCFASRWSVWRRNEEFMTCSDALLRL